MGEREDLTYKDCLSSVKICCVVKEMRNSLPAQLVPDNSDIPQWDLAVTLDLHI